MKKLYNLVEEADGIIFVTPIYWYNVPGPLKNFIDRLTVFENAIFIEGRSRLEGKVAGFIAIGNDTGAIAVIQNLMAILNSMGVAIPPWALAYHESEENIIENEGFMLDVANVVRGVVLMIKALKGIEKPSYWYRADQEYLQHIKTIFQQTYTEFSALRTLKNKQ
jgi:multimeric flavodoxin WrbA